MPKIAFPITQQEKQVAQGSELQRIHDLHPELPLKFGCRRGECGVCAIKVMKGMQNLTKVTKQEAETLKRKKLSGEYRLACQCTLNGDIEVG